MTLSAGKMRMPAAKTAKKAAKALKMKSVTTKKKKMSAAKAIDDSISETISFVIKGHLTPFKSTVLAKKTNVGKKNLKTCAKNKAMDNSTKKAKLVKKTREEKPVDLAKPPKAKAAKKADKKPESEIKIKKVTTKPAKNPSVTRKSSKKSMLNAINSLVSPDVDRGDIGKSLLVNHAANKVKNEISEKLPKKNTKENKQVAKVKTEVGETKKEIKNDVVKRRRSPVKAEVIEKDKQIKEKKSEATGKKIKKSQELKTKSVPNSPQQDRNVATRQKATASRLKQNAKDKPKKNRVSSTEPKQVNDDAKAVTSKTPKNNSIKEGVNSVKAELPAKRGRKSQTKRKIKSEESSLSTDDTSSTSDEITLDVLRQHHSEERKIKSEPTLKHSEETSATSKKVTVKAGHGADAEKRDTQKPAAVKQKLGRKVQKKAAEVKPKPVLIKKGVPTTGKNKAKRKEDQRSRKMKLFGFWNGPKRHRVASLNALAKVHCLYENETRGALLDNDSSKSDSHVDRKVEVKEEVLPTRTLRSAPGMRGVGKHWDMHDETFSSSEENESSTESPESTPKPQKPEIDKKPEKKRPYTKRRRNRCELIMDLKDMVVRKRMASLNASAILAASYSVEKRSAKSPKSEETDSEDSEESFGSSEPDNKKKCYEEDVKKEEDRKVIEVRATPNKKVSVILNQDTDVTITGVYVNSTTRSTHHEGYCSIAGMQYRISAKSHTQTASTTVATETIMQSAANIGQENTTAETPPHPCKSYTPLSALSSMQPPGTPGQHGVPLAPPPHMSSQHVIPLSASQHIPHTSPIGRRHGCPSAFSAPPPGPYGPPPPAHHHPPPPPPSDPGYIHGYYQPAGPLINVPSHGHPQPASLGKPAPLSEVSSSPTPPSSHQPHSQSSTADSMDSDVIITSATTSKEPLQPQQPPPTYRYSQYPAPHPGYTYGYPPQYYPAPPPAPSYHHDLCYPPNPYLHHKAYPPPTYRRHLTAPTGTQYYQANPPDLYHPPPSAPNQQSQQVVTASPAVSSAYQPPPSGPPPPLMESYPPPPTLVEPYPPPPHYYPSYGPAPPPSCYTHSPPTRTLPYINAAYQSCPCPMQSCPKNVHTGPLTGDSKRSAHISSIAKDSLPLPPVALALPLEPVSATGPPSPARGSAGMPPPPSPAGATYQPPPPAPKQEGAESLDCKPIEKRRKARVGKNMVRNNIAANFPENTMLLMCHPPQHNMCVAKVKREIESPEERKPCSDEIIKSKIEKTEITPLRTNSSTEVTADPSSVKAQKDVVTCLKTEEHMEPVTPNKVKDMKAIERTPEELLPCQKTVAENVKVKNMKRKLSITRDLEKADSETPPPQKKQKIDKAKVNGSYKDLIKKHVPSIRINNGKRKLNIDGDRPVIYKNSKLKLKKAVKRKLSPSKEETTNKRFRVSKPLTASNLHNSKQNLKNNKGKCFVDFELSENKEPFVKTKRSQVNSKSSLSNKKLAPAILDSLFAKNNVDRTIECVVNGYSDGLRTTKKSEGSAKAQEKCKNLKIISKQEPANTKSTNSKTGPVKSKVIVTKKVGASKRKSKSKSIDTPPVTVSKIPRRHLLLPRWSNGWTWKGEPFQAKIFLNSDEAVVIRKCYPAMRHSEGDIIEPRDCVLLKAGPRRNDLPFVAKVAALWENPEDGEMMMSLLWYYRPEHTEQGRQPYDEPDEVFASRHKDTNSVACIEDKCYVLTFNEYCRYRKSLRRFEEGMEDTGTCIPNPEPYPRILRQPPSTVQTPPDLVFFCRRVYDFRQKRIVKNPS